MATVEQRYEASVSYIRGAIAVVERGPLTLFDPLTEAVDYYVARAKTTTARSDLARLEARWFLAANDIERARLAREAELLADRVEEALPGSPQTRPRTNLFPGEKQTSTPATSFEKEAQAAADEAWSKAKSAVSTAKQEANGIGTALLVGGGILLGFYLVSRLQPRNREERHESINQRLAEAAEHRNGSRTVVAHTTICHHCRKHSR